MQVLLSGNASSSHRHLLVRSDCAMASWQSPGLVVGVFYGEVCGWKLYIAEFYHLYPFVNVSPGICAI